MLAFGTVNFLFYRLSRWLAGSFSHLLHFGTRHLSPLLPRGKEYAFPDARVMGLWADCLPILWARKDCLLGQL